MENVKDWFDEELKVIELEEVRECQSNYGNNFYKITNEQIELLEKGKVLWGGGEYGIFIMVEND